jgi:hypothetical protein
VPEGRCKKERKFNDTAQSIPEPAGLSQSPILRDGTEARSELRSGCRARPGDRKATDKG